MRLKVLFTALFVLFAFALKAQDSYLFSYLNGTAFNQRADFISRPMQNGVMTVCGVSASKFYYPNSLVILFHDFSGKLVWERRYDFPIDLVPSDAVVVNNELHMVGTSGREGGSGYPDYGGFSMVLTENGTVKYYQTMRLAAASMEVVSRIHYLKGSQQYVVFAEVDESVNSSSPIYNALLILDKDGVLISAHRFGEDYYLYPIYDAARDQLYIMTSNMVFTMDKNFAVVAARSLSLNQYESTNRTFEPANDSVFFQTYEYQQSTGQYYYYLGLWIPSSNSFQRLIRLDNPIRDFVIRPGGGAYFTTVSGANLQHYLVDAQFNIERSNAQAFNGTYLNAAAGSMICGDKLLSFVVPTDSAQLIVSKSDENWNFPAGQTLAKGIDQVRANLTTTGIAVPYLDSVNEAIQPPYQVNSGIESAVYNDVQVMAADTNCRLIDLPFDSLVVCREDTTLTPLEFFRNCLPAGTTRSYLWGIGEYGLSNTISHTGWQKVSVFEDVCISSDSAYIIFDPVKIHVSGDTLFCGDLLEKVTLKAQANTDSIFWNYRSVRDSVLVTNIPGYATATGYSRLGCAASDSIRITELCEELIYVPSAFTPDGDSHNDVFSVSTEFARVISFEIYSRWGDVIYQSGSGAPIAWDGTLKGENCSQGLYEWRLVYQPLLSGGEKIKRGAVNLFR